ncbi:MAG: hypothetical protein CMG74_09080 [Candidatus Marinimicrobia bacterium]|nr:hypothetical protein [Candidatus Neomarinimicrobiota bacterium]|tara:strand:- start:948 stop:1535 length:588 start_codon:yes stop_codon:yes gene_type:complete
MRKISSESLLNIIEYEKVRNEYRKEIIEYKKNRRISLGPNVMITFENEKTLSFQIQEIMRSERLADDIKIEEEVNIYNTIMPPENGLSATLFIGITDEKKIKSVLNRFIGLTIGKTLYFKFNGESVYAKFEQGREEKDKISSVHYLQFHFTENQKIAFSDRSQSIELIIDYNEYKYKVILSSEMIDCLSKDFINI